MKANAYKFFNDQWFLIVIPIAFLLISQLFHLGMGQFFERSVDPEYSLLYNGISIAKGNLAINFIDHPATPLIFLVAISSSIVHFISGDLSLIIDFLEDPERYLYAAIFLNSLLIALFLYYASYKIYKYTKSIPLALLFQLSIFLNASILSASGRLIPESTMVIPLLIIMALAVKYIFSTSAVQLNSKLRYYLSIAVAFGIACKLSFVPLVIFPLVLFKFKFKDGLKFLGITALFTLIFAYPLVTNLKKSFAWVFNMFIHSGKHGVGKSNFIQVDKIYYNFISLFQDDPLFFVSLFLTFLWIVILKLRVNKSEFENKIMTTLSAFSLSVLVAILFTLKHFSLHYFIPFYILKIFPILLFVFYLKQLNFFKLKLYRTRLLNIFFLGLTIVVCLHQLGKAKNLYKHQLQTTQELNIKNEKIRSLINDENSILIANAPYFGSPFIAYANIFGFMNSYKRKTSFKDELRERFPNFYLYVTWMDKFNHWDKFMSLSEISNKPRIIYVYNGPHMQDLEIIESRINAYNGNLKKKVLFHEKNNNELLIEYRIN